VETIISSSFNFTKAAESKNAENLLIIQSPEIAKYSSTAGGLPLIISAKTDVK
jgi:phosphatidylserine/phosphatidylglycerophosphate/cardiolipin synthase-like enzyme